MKEQLSKTLLSTAYLPSISWFKIMLNAKGAFIEQHENYIKQSYRNRCHILAANGVMSLSIPVVKASNKKIKITDVKIDYATAWQKQHLKSIESAYRNSPFYEYLIDDILPFYEKKHKFLFDLNLQIIYTILEILELKKEIKLSKDFIEPTNDNFDYRNRIKPKKQSEKVSQLANKKYYQVFNEKHPFQADLSIIDLLFNLGSESYGYLVK